MATYTAAQLKGAGTPTEALHLTAKTFTLNNPLSGFSLFYS